MRYSFKNGHRLTLSAIRLSKKQKSKKIYLMLKKKKLNASGKKNFMFENQKEIPMEENSTEVVENFLLPKDTADLEIAMRKEEGRNANKIMDIDTTMLLDKYAVEKEENLLLQTGNECSLVTIEKGVDGKQIIPSNSTIFMEQQTLGRGENFVLLKDKRAPDLDSANKMLQEFIVRFHDYKIQYFVILCTAYFEAGVEKEVRDEQNKIPIKTKMLIERDTAEKGKNFVLMQSNEDSTMEVEEEREYIKPEMPNSVPKLLEKNIKEKGQKILSLKMKSDLKIGIEKNMAREKDLKQRTDSCILRQKENRFTIIRGSFHQGDRQIFKEDSVGLQCTANAGVAIVMCSIKNLNSWTTDDVNTVLLIGDQLYRKCLQTPNRVSAGEKNGMYLAPRELHDRSVKIGNSIRKIVMKLADLGHLFKERFGCLKLEDRLKTFLQNDGSAILTVNSKSIALGKKDNQIWMFDSHAGNSVGESSDARDAAACLTLYPTVNNLFQKIITNLACYQDDGSSSNTFELHPVENDFVNKTDIIFDNIKVSSRTNLENVESMLIKENTKEVSNKTFMLKVDEDFDIGMEAVEEEEGEEESVKEGTPADSKMMVDYSTADKRKNVFLLDYQNSQPRNKAKQEPQSVQQAMVTEVTMPQQQTEKEKGHNILPLKGKDDLKTGVEEYCQEDLIPRSRSSLRWKEKTFTIIRGSFHQGDRQIFKEDSVGLQCTANAGVAIVMCSIKNLNSWTTDDVNTVLLIGDQLYRKCLQTPNRVSAGEKNGMYLAPRELHDRSVKIGNSIRKIVMKLADLGHLSKERFGCLKLEDRLKTFLQNDGSAILTVNSKSIALGKKDNQIWMFDSHAGNSVGKSSDARDAAACLTLYPTVNNLFQKIITNLACYQDDGSSSNTFELHPVETVFLVREDAIVEERRVSATMIMSSKNNQKRKANESKENNERNVSQKQQKEHFSEDELQIGDVKGRNGESSSTSEGAKSSKRNRKKKRRIRRKHNNSSEDTDGSRSTAFSTTDRRDRKRVKNEYLLNLSDSDISQGTLRSSNSNISSKTYNSLSESTHSESENNPCNYGQENSHNSLYTETSNESSEDSISSSEQHNEEKNNSQKVPENKKNKKCCNKIENIDESEVILTNWSTVWDQLSTELEKHSNSDCSFVNVKLTNLKREGNRVCHIFKCEKCIWSANIWSTPEDENCLDINESLVLGAINCGIGFTQATKFLSASGVNFMSNDRYQNCRDNAHNILWNAMQENMRQAGKEELEAAINSGNVTEDGKGLITVLADGSWMKRSYKAGNYNSPAGLAYIIGQKTGKILWIEIKNMYCSICDRAGKTSKKIKNHKCYKNWSRNESSTSMEAAAILEGFQKSVEEHNLIYKTIIADGDSSVYNKIREGDPYAAYGIEVDKYECSKHLRRGFQNKVKNIAGSKRGYVGKARKIVETSGRKCVAELDRILQYYWDEEEEIDNDMCNRAAAAIENIPRHIFGDHQNCSRVHPLCDGIPQQKEANQVPLLQKWGFVDEIEEAIGRLSRNAKSLLINMDTNLVESANAIVAEKIEAKRINFALRNEYHCRVYAAALQFNSRKVVTNYYNFAGKKIPTVTKNVEEVSIKKHEDRKSRAKGPRKRRRGKGYDKDYGPNCQQPDVDDETYARKLAAHEEEVKKLMGNRDQIELDTRNQANSADWRRYRKQLITATFCHRICRKRDHTSCHNIVKDIRYGREIVGQAIEWGCRNEPFAKEELGTFLNETILNIGLVLHREIPGLAASPDGILEESGDIIEIKCPHSAASYSSITDAYLDNVQAVTKLFTNENCVEIRSSHSYFYQIQMQLNVLEKENCYLMVWIPQDAVVVKIKRNEEFWNNHMKPKLILFYETCLVPEIIDSRLNRRMQVKDPDHIIEAKEKHKQSKLNQIQKEVKKDQKSATANKECKHVLESKNNETEENDCAFTDQRKKKRNHESKKKPNIGLDTLQQVNELKSVKNGQSSQDICLQRSDCHDAGKLNQNIALPFNRHVDSEKIRPVREKKNQRG